MPCHAILIPSFLPAAATIYRSPKRHAAARQRRHQTTPNAGGGSGKKNTWTELHPLHACVAPWHVPAAKKKKKRPSDDTRRSSFAQGRAKRENSACSKRQAGIHTSRATPPPPPPLVSCRIRACLVCNCTSPLVRSSRPPHTQISGDSTGTQCPCRSSADVRSWPVFRAGFNGDGVAQEGRVRDFHTTRAGRAD